MGDRAARMALDAVAAARAVNGPRDARHHVAHLELVDPADVPRFAALGVAADVQGAWAWRDAYVVDLTEPLLGPERSARLYPYGALGRAPGLRLVGGSDWPVSSMNPLQAIQVAVTRRSVDEGPGPAWLPEEAADLDTMLAAYTINGAWVAGNDDETGSLEPGKAADLVVLERDLADVPPGDLHDVCVLLTMVRGREVYRRDGFAPAARRPR